MSEAIAKPPGDGLPTVGQLRKTYDAEGLVARTIKARDRLAAMKKDYSESIQPFLALQERLEAALLETLNEIGGDSIKTKAGTAYKTTRTSAKVERWSLTLDYIRAKEAWELLEARVSKTAALEIVKETGTSIPGVTISTEVALNVRRD